MVKAPTPVEPTSSIVVHAVGTPSPARRSRPVSDARLPPAACGIGRIARDPSRRCASPRLPARCWRTHSGDGEPWLLTSESPAKSHRGEEEDTFPKKKIWRVSFFTMQSRGALDSTSPKSSRMHPNMCDHALACMRAHACTHACTRRMRRVVCSVSRYTRSLHGSSFWAPADSAECMLNQVRGLLRSTVARPGIGTEPIGTILRFASVPLKKIGTDLLGSLWPCQCVLPTLYCIESGPNLELASENCES